MTENALESFTGHIFTALTCSVVSARGLLIKKHSENLHVHGDFSFPSSVKSWHEYLKGKAQVQDSDVSLLQCIRKNVNDLVEESTNWNLLVRNVREDAGRVFLFLDRPFAITVGFSEAVRINVLISQKMETISSRIHIDPLSIQKSDLTSLRVKYLGTVIENLCAIYEKSSDVLLTSRSTFERSERKVFNCGPVLNAKSKSKEIVISSQDFIRMRQDEMTLIAQHKYGVRVTTDSKWREFLSHLGESAVTFELLQGRPSSAIKVDFENAAAGSSKGASFILYNCARLETIIRTYNDKVEEGIYPELPASDETDFKLLSLEEEWNLIFNYILGFPYMLDQCIEICETRCEFRPHYICNFLSSMVRVFSQYYRRTRILVEPRKHLLPVINARIHMLKILNDTLKICLKILNIKSVSQM